MKTKIYFYLTVIFCSPLFAQKQDSIVYDFSKGIYEKNGVEPEFGKPIVFKIKNINRIFYNPVIKGIIGEDLDSNIGLRAPAKTDNIDGKVPTSANIESQIFDKKLEKQNFIIKNLSQSKDFSSEDLNISTEALDFKSSKPDTANKLYSEFKKKLSVLSQRMQIYVYVINKMNGSYNNYLEKINTPHLTYDIYKKLYQDSNLKTNTLDSFERSAILNAKKHEDKYVTLNEYLECKIEFKDFLDSKEVQDIILEFNSTGNTFVSENIKKEIDEWKTYITKTDVDINKMNLHQKLNYVEIVNRVLLNKDSYVYVSEPIQAYGDYLSFDIDIKEKKKIDDEYVIFSSTKKFSYKEFVKGGMRLDFGVGVSLDFGSKNQEYVINEDNVGNKYLLSSTKSDYSPKLVGLLHASKRSSNNIAFGFSLGTALDVANFDISSIYIGPSLLWGRSNKIIFTAGPSFKKIKELNPEFQKYTGQIALPSSFNLDETKYVNSYKIGIFFAITYNLTNTQRGKFLQLSTPNP